MSDYLFSVCRSEANSNSRSEDEPKTQEVSSSIMELSQEPGIRSISTTDVVRVARAKKRTHAGRILSMGLKDLSIDGYNEEKEVIEIYDTRSDSVSSEKTLDTNRGKKRIHEQPSETDGGNRLNTELIKDNPRKRICKSDSKSPSKIEKYDIGLLDEDQDNRPRKRPYKSCDAHKLFAKTSSCELISSTRYLKVDFAEEDDDDDDDDKFPLTSSWSSFSARSNKFDFFSGVTDDGEIAGTSSGITSSANSAEMNFFRRYARDGKYAITPSYITSSVGTYFLSEYGGSENVTEMHDALMRSSAIMDMLQDDEFSDSDDDYRLGKYMELNSMFGYGKYRYHDEFGSSDEYELSDESESSDDLEYYEGYDSYDEDDSSDCSGDYSDSDFSYKI
ncbi:hypothetical protein [Candidatus Ichthyocystis sparus]|uniref:hypothetical protein n=1 Tax=Candidatus Ichthyocystis sparus TaxID=1561004 RepID=UPI000B8310C9|nr:hypothetical protein [Candidatus Ichthyocystis sparus]